MTPLRRLVMIRTGGAVRRCHGIHHTMPYRVDSHTWGVLVLLWLLWPEDFPRLSAAVLFHDVQEAWVGDIPAPTKRYSSAVKAAIDAMDEKVSRILDLPYDGDLDPEDQRKVKACDHLELYLWAAEEVYAGNRHAACVVRELERYFEETPLLPTAHDLYMDIRRGSVEHATDRLVMEINR